ncbi:MAG: putative exonuclease [Chlamydiia bacterium]|nr:putative exonuclease [Chlamydiia bacterium]
MLGIFLDQETTGLDSHRHRVLDFACKIIDLSTGEELAAYDSVLSRSQEEWESRDPLSIEINGFTWEDTITGKVQEDVAEEIKKIFKKVKIQRGKSVFICQNPSFDRPFFAQIIDPYTQEKLFWPYHWLDLASMYWALEIKKCKELHSPIPDELRLSKDTIAAALNLPKEARPHKAMNGVNHLLLCYHTIVGFPEQKGR